MVDVASLGTAPIRVNELVEEFAPVTAHRRDAQHPEVSIRLRKFRWSDGRKIRRRQIIDHGGLHHLTIIQINHKSDRLALAHIGKQVRHYLVLVIDRAVEFYYVNHEPALFLIAVDEVQAIAIADWNRQLSASINVRPSRASDSIFRI